MSSEENQFNVQGYNIVTMLKRLEAATSRLEDISILQSEGSKSDGQSVKSLGKGQGLAAGNLQQDKETMAVKANEEPEQVPKSVVEFQHFIEKSIIPFVTSSQAIGSLVEEAAMSLEQAFQAQLQFLTVLPKSKKPEMSDPAFLEILKPINEKIEEINKIKDTNRGLQFYNHLNTISEGAPVLGWIVGDTPMSLIPEFKDSAQFWSNRVMKEYKDKDQKHVTWVSQFLNIFEALKAYVKEFHTSGPSWNNAKGRPLAEVLGASQGTSSATGVGGGGAPPPPPPPPPASIFDSDNTQSTPAAAGGINAVFADLNKGENITSGLKKVDTSEMTHKNPSLRQAAPPASKKPTPPKKPSSLSSSQIPVEPKKKVPKMELVDGTKWIIENFTESDAHAQKPLVIEAEMHQSVFIGNCAGITVQVKGKANAVSMSDTRNTGIVVDSLISGIDIIKSFKFGLQVVGTVAMVSIDKSDEGSIYLSKQSVEADAQIFTSCTTSLNVNVLKHEDYEELAIPEQFKHSIRNGKLVSEVVEHSG